LEQSFIEDSTGLLTSVPSEHTVNIRLVRGNEMSSVIPPSIENNPDLLGRLATPTGLQPSPEEREEQLISFVYGNLPASSKLTRPEVAERIKRTQLGG
jgi:hypothetical protein